MDLKKIATEAAFGAGLSRKRSEDIGTTIAGAIENAMREEKDKKKKPVKKEKDITEIDNTYEDDVMIDEKK